MSSRDSIGPAFRLHPHEFREAADRRKMRLHLVGDGVDLEAIALAQRNADLEGVDRIETEAFAKEPLLAVDVLDAKVLELQHLYDQRLDIVFEFIHEQAVPYSKSVIAGRVGARQAIGTDQAPRRWAAAARRPSRGISTCATAPSTTDRPCSASPAGSR